ncbi:MAG: hypothetical protein ACRDVP_01785 [Acidimicrobiales bacterium]
MAPGSPGVAERLIDPAWLVAATLHVHEHAGMTGTRVCGVPPEARFGLEQDTSCPIPQRGADATTDS